MADAKVVITAEDRTKRGLDSVNRNLNRTAKNAQVVTGRFGNLRGASQQLGFQIQDVAVQLQGGTSAAQVFGQQGSQIASIFGPGGAVIGALIAVGAAVAGPFISAIFGGTNALKEMEAAADEVAGGLFAMTQTERIVALAKNEKLVADARDAIAQATNKSAEAEAKLKRLRPGGDLAGFLGGKELGERIRANEKAVADAQATITASTIVIEKAEQAQSDFAKALNAEKLREANEALRERTRLAKEIADAEKEAGAILLGINQSNIDKSIEERREKKRNKNETLANLDEQLTASSRMSKEMFQVNKAFRIAQATMQTRDAATKALAAFPPPFGQLAAIATIAFGLQQVAAIKSASFEGGGFTGMGARSGGIDGRGGFLATLHPNESVIDHTKGQGAGVTIINNVDARGSSADVDQKIRVAMQQTSQQTVMTIQDLMRRRRFV